jgi:SAM-dependent methyltransferase
MKSSDYAEDQMLKWEEITRRQFSKDKGFVAQLEREFVPGSVLEIGAGLGQLSRLLAERGWDVVCSDRETHFVRYMQGSGLLAFDADALDLSAATSHMYHNVFTQGLSTLITRDVEVVRRTYTSVYNVLEPGGRFVFIFPNAYRGHRWSSFDHHKAVALSSGFSIVRAFRHQVFPSRAYRVLPDTITHCVETSIGRRFGIRWVITLQK